MSLLSLLNTVFNNRQDQVLNLIMEYKDDYKSLYSNVLKEYKKGIMIIEPGTLPKGVYWRFKSCVEDLVLFSRVYKIDIQITINDYFNRAKARRA